MIYLVEDDDSIRELIVYTLNNLGMKTIGFSIPSSFWNSMKDALTTVILLDVMLPEEDGLHILKKIRSTPAYKKLPVMMLTAKTSEYDKVVGLDLGADDYVPKPFGMMELVARIKALIRRTEDVATELIEYRIGDLYVCPSKHIVKVDGHEILLTLKEFEILCLLLENRDIVLTRDQLLDKIWGYSFDGENRTVDVHIRTLRHKLGLAGDFIKTVRGVGYKIGEEE